MPTWTKKAALTELARLIREIDHLTTQRRRSADHINWMARTIAFLEEVFGRESMYMQFLTALTWSREGMIFFGGPGDRCGSLNPQAAVKREHQRAYVEQLDSAKGMLQAAADHLRRVKDITEVYQGKDTAPEASAILKIIGLAEHKLRRVIREKPSSEREVQDAFENLLIGADIPYKREKERIEYSSKTYTPDFTFPRLDLALDLKFCGTKDAEKRLIKEINDYIVAFRSKYANAVFVVYDLGFIRDVDLFTGSFEEHGEVIVRVVKH